jgi:putative hydrolase of the HAD superfamily
MITTVIFDLDDTLYDEAEYCKSGFRAVAGYLAGQAGAESLEKIYDTIWKHFYTGNRTKTFNAALDEIGIKNSEKLINQLIDLYRSHKPQITLPPDSRQTLDGLYQKYTLGLLTDGFLPAQKLKVEALRIEKYFKCIIYSEELGRDCWKPSPAGFEKMLKNLNIKAENAVYVADNEQKDFIAPNKLGLITIEINRPAGIHRSINNAPYAAAQHKISTIKQLSALIQDL